MPRHAPNVVEDVEINDEVEAKVVVTNDDVSIEAYEENDSDEEIAEINNCLKSNNEEKNDPIDQINYINSRDIDISDRNDFLVYYF